MTVDIGFGGAGRMTEMHSECLADIENAVVVGYADIDRERAEGLAARFGADDAVDRVESLLEHVDAVWIVTLPFAHVEPAMAAVRAGKDVFVEKPLAVEREDAEALVETAAAAELN